MGIFMALEANADSSIWKGLLFSNLSNGQLIRYHQPTVFHSLDQLKLLGCWHYFVMNCKM